MLEELTIKDFALISSAHIEFSKGFTVLSGETGAGKSLLIGALSFLLGGKSGVEQIRTGAQEAVVSGLFYLEDNISKECKQWLDDHGIEPEDNRLLLRRYVRATGKTGAWIGETAVTKNDLAVFSSYLIDIHGQHEHQLLMKVSEHRKYLDAYARIDEMVSEYNGYYNDLIAKRGQLEVLNQSDKDRQQRIDVLSFAVSEIEDAKIKSGEDEELEEEEKRLSGFEKLYGQIQSITSLFDGDGNDGIISLLKKLKSITSHAGVLDKNLDSLDKRFESVFYELNDICDEYKDYERHLVFDPDRLTLVQDRLTLFYNLKKKYASSINAPVSEVLDFQQQARKKLESLTGCAESKESLIAEIEVLEKKVYTLAKHISDIRIEYAKKMSDEVMSILSKLGMSGTRFSVSVLNKDGTEVEQLCGPYGMDNIEFLISANPGSPLQSLAKIASGGELSRVMLSIKTILSETDSVNTLIFDEIDTGIGGEVAVSVGSHLKALAKNKQILCITHLASIAVYADNQVKIKKGVDENITKTSVYPISGEDRVAEIARMLAGDSVSTESLDHARSMLEKHSSLGA